MTERVVLKVDRVTSSSTTYADFFNQTISGKGINHLIISASPDTNAKTYGLLKIRIGDDYYKEDLQLEAIMTIEYERLERGVYLRPRQGEIIQVGYRTSNTTYTVAFGLLVQYSQVME